MTIIHSKIYSFRKKWELFIQQIIQLEKNYSTKYSFNKFENYSFKNIILFFFEKLIIAQGYTLVTGMPTVYSVHTVPPPSYLCNSGGGDDFSAENRNIQQNRDL